MAANTSFKHQILAVQDLGVSPDPERYEVATFTVEQMGNVLFVVRRMQHKLHSSITVHQTFKVGRRGAITTLSDSSSSLQGEARLQARVAADIAAKRAA